MFTIIAIVVLMYAAKNLFADSVYAIRGQRPSRWQAARHGGPLKTPILSAIGRYVAALIDDSAKERATKRNARRAKKSATNHPADELDRRRRDRRATDPQDPTAEPGASAAPAGTSRKDSSVTAPAGEAAGFESTIALLDAMAARLDRMGDACDALDNESQALAPESEQVQEFLASKNADATTMGGIADVVAGVDLEAIAELIQKIEVAKSGVAAAKASLVALYGDAADTVASTGVDPTLLASA